MAKEMQDIMVPFVVCATSQFGHITDATRHLLHFLAGLECPSQLPVGMPGTMQSSSGPGILPIKSWSYFFPPKIRTCQFDIHIVTLGWKLIIKVSTVPWTECKGRIVSTRLDELFRSLPCGIVSLCNNPSWFHPPHSSSSVIERT